MAGTGQGGSGGGPPAGVVPGGSPGRPYRPVRNAAQARLRATALGIQRVNIPQGTPPEILNATLEPLHHLRQQGGAMPDGLEVDAVHFSPQAIPAGVLAAAAEFDPHTRTLWINPHPALWDQQDRRLRADPAVRDLSTPDLQGTVYHEYAHLVVRDHYATGAPGGTAWVAAWAVLQDEQPDQQPVVRFQAIRAGGRGNSPFTDIAREVSDRAASSALEFLSEVFAALMTRQPVSPRAHALYDDMAPSDLLRLAPPGP